MHANCHNPHCTIMPEHIHVLTPFAFLLTLYPIFHGYSFRLYDTDATMQVVKKWVDFYKTYRDILISDIVHVRRPDMQGKCIP